MQLFPYNGELIADHFPGKCPSLKPSVVMGEITFGISLMPGLSALAGKHRTRPGSNVLIPPAASVPGAGWVGGGGGGRERGGGAGRRRGAERLRVSKVLR